MIMSGDRGILGNVWVILMFLWVLLFLVWNELKDVVVRDGFWI